MSTNPLLPLKNQTPIHKVWSRLAELNCYVDSEMIQAVLAAYEEFVVQTPEGVEYITDRLGFSAETGHSDREYHIADTNMVVKGGDITFLQGTYITYRHQGKVVTGFVHTTHVDDYGMDKEQCDLCFANTHCCKEYVASSGKTMKVCFSCLNKTDDTSLSTHAPSSKECEQCTVRRCPNHPYNTDKYEASL